MLSVLLTLSMVLVLPFLRIGVIWLLRDGREGAWYMDTLRRSLVVFPSTGQSACSEQRQVSHQVVVFHVGQVRER